MTEQQTRSLADIVAEAQGRDPITFNATRLNPGESGDKDQLRFTWTMHTDNSVVLQGDWFCGSYVPLQNYGGVNLSRRVVAREKFLPSMATVIESLLLDFVSAREHVDGWDWAKECGYGDGSSMADIRKMVEAHPQVMRHGRFLADWFGDLMEAAEQAAIEG